MTNSRRKGKNGELDAARNCARVFGGTWRRGQQYQGGPDSPDIIGMAGAHIEVKRGQQLNAYKALQQANRDAAPGEIGFVLHRRNGEPWQVTLHLDDAPNLAHVWLWHMEKHGGPSV